MPEQYPKALYDKNLKTALARDEDEEILYRTSGFGDHPGVVPDAPPPPLPDAETEEPKERRRFFRGPKE